MGIVMFNGKSSKDVGIEVETFPTYDVPEKEFEVIHVPVMLLSTQKRLRTLMHSIR